MNYELKAVNEVFESNMKQILYIRFTCRRKPRMLMNLIFFYFAYLCSFKKLHYCCDI